MTVTAHIPRDHLIGRRRRLPSIEDVQRFHDHYAEAAPTQALRDLHAGLGYQVKAIADLHPDVKPVVRRRLSNTTGITQNRLDMLRLVALGHFYPAIAERLGISVETVKTQLRPLFAALGVNERAAAIAVAVLNGYLVLCRADDGSLVVETVLNPVQEVAA